MSNLMTRKYSIQMRHVAMLALGSLEIPVIQPFLQLTLFANLHRRQTLLHFREFGAEIFIDTENFCRPDTLFEQIANDLRVHCWTGTNRNATRVFVLG